MENKKAYIFGAIFLFSNKLQNAGDKLFDEISMKQWLLLISIGQSKIKNPTLTQVSEIMGYSRQNVKKLALHLEHNNFVKLEKDSEDNRAIRICLTKKCFNYFKGRENIEEEFIENLYKNITDDEIDSMFSIMKKLEDNILNLDI
ncbi:MarR family transcriptional regulator [Clostridium sp. ATCC 25772]|uniref:MarR family winged helix-turn-helix transcriptional regulator n=1 Tax=Clostridium sp. ATCC 25772 TaxID=1676991 RepID=UPI0007831792|nr:MarR family transcriptional regulator [Clostridium sp. ATCC 25772]